MSWSLQVLPDKSNKITRIWQIWNRVTSSRYLAYIQNKKASVARYSSFLAVKQVKASWRTKSWELHGNWSMTNAEQPRKCWHQSEGVSTREGTTEWHSNCMLQTQYSMNTQYYLNSRFSECLSPLNNHMFKWNSRKYLYPFRSQWEVYRVIILLASWFNPWTKKCSVHCPRSVCFYTWNRSDSSNYLLFLSKGAAF